jgi:hypothetical protein
MLSSEIVKCRINTIHQMRIKMLINGDVCIDSEIYSLGKLTS